MQDQNPAVPMMQYSFTSADLNRFREKDISLEAIEVQLENFRNGFPHVSLVAPAIQGDGIIRLSKDEAIAYAGKYKSIQHNLQIIKLIPASGAASRMFKNLYEYLSQEGGNSAVEKIDPAVNEFIGGLDNLALTENLEELLRHAGKDLKTMVAGGEFHEIIAMVLNREGLNYGQLPKGLIKFHKYPGE
ncbi:MAG: DUF4301 family protein, partial [Gammaproteobacteria bacterium]|nr:DUF4301 family protein [Gammaproteobacteria bacterium]